jgi:uncharacterized membrane-anchored protein
MKTLLLIIAFIALSIVGIFLLMSGGVSFLVYFFVSESVSIGLLTHVVSASILIAGVYILYQYHKRQIKQTGLSTQKNKLLH